MCAEFGESVLNAWEEAVEEGEVGDPRGLQQRWQSLAQDAPQVLTYQLLLHAVDQLTPGNEFILVLVIHHSTLDNLYMYIFFA